MDKITEDIIKLVQLRYPFANVVFTHAGTLQVEAYHPNLIDGEKHPEEDGSEEEAYLSSAGEYMRGLQYLAISQPEDLLLLVKAAERSIREKFREFYGEGQAQAEADLQCNQLHVMATPEVYDEWACLGSWSLHEAVLLLLGRNPSAVSSDVLTEVIEISLDDDVTYVESSFSKAYHELMRVVLSHSGEGAGQLPDPVRPNVFLAWARRYKKPIPPYLALALSEYHDPAEANVHNLLQGSGKGEVSLLSGHGSRQDSPIKHILKSKRHPLDAVIAKAELEAVDKSDYMSVWAALIKMAESHSPPPPLVKFVEGTLQYTSERSENGFSFYTKEALAERYRRLSRKIDRAR